MAILRKLEKNDNQEVQIVEKAPKKHFGSDHDESNWLISYADMMTLLCVFYIMMFSMSKINVPEFEKVKKEVAKQFNAKYESPTADLGKFVTQVLQEAGVSKDVSITSDGVSVSLAFHSTLFFGTSSAEISNEGKTIVDRIAVALKDKQEKLKKTYKVVVEGHTDSQPIVGGPFPSNWELSSGRATRVIRLFLDQGFNAQNLLAIGYADTQPVVESRNPDGSWNTENLAKNRRVVIRVLLPEVDNIPWKVTADETGKAVSKAEARKDAPATTPETVAVKPAQTGVGTEAPAKADAASVQAIAPANGVTQVPVTQPVATDNHAAVPVQPAAVERVPASAEIPKH